ncbi:MAG: membrane protein insertase YidC [Spirochaetaceae bacterium]|nr:membrane protein insertase YidC [Spirochaetaceae bacterium]
MNEILDNNQDTKQENKRMILAVVLSTLIMGVGFMISGVLFPPDETSAAKAQGTEMQGNTGSVVTTLPSEAKPSPILPAAVAEKAGKTEQAAVVVEAPATETVYTVETDIIVAEISNAGGDIVSLKLKNHKDKNDYVDMLVPGEKGTSGLSVAFGKSSTAPMKDLMNVTWLDDSHTTIQFSRTLFAKPAGKDELIPFTYKKVYNFRNKEYMFGMAVTLENSKNENLPLNSDGMAYTIQVGPQIGPKLAQVTRYSDFRKYIYEVGGKKKSETPKAGIKDIQDVASWASLTGKYFTFIAIPSAPFAQFEYVQDKDSVLPQTNWMYISRPAIQASRQTDTYYFYFGPKTAAELSKYEYADKNQFGLSSLRLEDTIERSNILGWLENFLKFLLDLCYKLIPNYGVAIILVTILIKAVFYPLTKKGSFATARMQELQPQIQELQVKYKNNQEKLNQEMAELYKREHYNPMSGCLPMLIQFPLFFAMYNLFNNHFELRGASFIPGWINDLSLPESILSFGGFSLPLLGWTDLRALPIIYLVSQLFYGKFTQQQPQAQENSQSAKQMQLMTYGMPIMFFFILYDVPAGLLIYWIINNVATIIQQMAINKVIKSRKTAAEATGPTPVGATSVSGTASAKSDRGAARGGANTTASGKAKSSAVAKKANQKKGPTRQQEDFSQKVTNWLEKKAGGEKPGDGKSNGSKAGRKNDTRR